MGKLRIVSDLHLEFNPFYRLEEMNGENQTYLILAGDICTWDSFPQSFFDDCAKRFKQIYYVPGNHEYFHRTILDTENEMNEFFSNNYDNIDFVNNESRVIENTKFIFSTLWSDASSPLAISRSNLMSDYKAIKGLSPTVTTYLHYRSVDYIVREFEKSDYVDNIIVTHHLPTFKSVHSRYHQSPIGMFFYSDLDHIIEKYSPKMWIHGHSHTSVDYLLYGTNIISNPRDYGVTAQPDYNPFFLRPF